MKFKRKQLISVIIFIVMVVSIATGVYIVNKNKTEPEKTGAAGGISLSFSPTNPSSLINTNFTMKLVINPNAHAVSAMDVKVNFDKTKLSLISASVAPSFGKTLIGPTIDNTNGNVRVVMGVLPPASPVSVAGDVLTLNFKTLTTLGTAQVSVDASSQAAAIGYETNVLDGYGSTTVGVVAPGTPTATPIATSNATPTSTPTVTTLPGLNTYLSIQDSYVAAGSATSNYGSNTTALASNYESANIRTAYLKFNVGNLTNIQSAELQLTAALDRAVAKNVYVTGTSWTESTINYSNKPALLSQVGYLNHLGSSLTVGEVVKVTLDATKLTPDSSGNISLAVDNISSNSSTFTFYTRESAANTPKLVLNGSSVQPTATPVATPTRTPTATPTRTPTGTPLATSTGVNTPTPTSTSAIRGDVDGNGCVNIVDLGIIIDYYGQTPPADPRADVSGDGKVNIIDVGILIDNYGLGSCL